MRIPEPEDTLSNRIDRFHERGRSNFSPYVEFDRLSHHCDRWVWLLFRWAVIPSFTGREARISRRDQMEKSLIISDLRAIGVDVRVGGKTPRLINFGGHVASHYDGVIEFGVPEAPNKRHVAVLRSHSRAEFEFLEAWGVSESFVHAQLAMFGLDIDRALYVGVCKDDDRIYTERIRLDKKRAEQLLDRGKRIALEDQLPPLPKDRDGCAKCEFREFCYETKTTTQVNCRTCEFGLAKSDGTWRCERYEADDIPIEFQQKGCDSHVLRADLVAWKRIDFKEGVASYALDNKVICNGTPAKNVYGSGEILSNMAACLSNDKGISDLREKFDAKITG